MKKSCDSNKYTDIFPYSCTVVSSYIQGFYSHNQAHLGNTIKEERAGQRTFSIPQEPVHPTEVRPYAVPQHLYTILPV